MLKKIKNIQNQKVMTNFSVVIYDKKLYSILTEHNIYWCLYSENKIKKLN